VADPEQYFLAADAFTLTSRDDPFPCVIHEAMACALPIVAFDGSGGAKEAISGGCGIVVPYLNIEAMARSLTSVIEDPLQHAGMGQSAELRVRSVYAFSEYAERIWEICEVVMGKRALYEGRDNRGWIAPHKGEHFGEDARFASEEKWPEIPRTFQVRRAEMTDWIWALPGSVARTIRTGQWWYHKLVPIYSVFYATAYVQHVSVASIWSAAVALLLAIVPCAAYVSLVNDLTDRADDRHAGKFNRMAGRPVWQMTVLVTAPLCAAVFFILLWRDDILLVGAYLCSWLAFSVYSLPPFRLKSRGVLGVIADACGSHVFPALVAALLARRATGGPIDQVWTAAVAAWALGYGLRGILWHQLYDFEADRKAGVQTFVLTHSARAAVGFARLALVIEIAGLAIVLWQIKSPLPPLFLLIYTVFAILKSRIWNVAIVIAEPCDRYSILGTEYYTLLFPFALLLSSALQYPADWVVLIAHSIVFRQPAVLFFREMRQLLLDIAQAQRRSRMHQSGP
jgi:hypothetical protein